MSYMRRNFFARHSDSLTGEDCVSSVLSFCYNPCGDALRRKGHQHLRLAVLSRLCSGMSPLPRADRLGCEAFDIMPQ